MGYVDTVLLPGETVRFRTGRHWVLYLPGLGCVALAAASLTPAVISYLNDELADSLDGLWSGLALAFLAVGAALLARAWYRRRLTEIAVTDRRVIYKSGLLHRSTSEMPLDRIERIDVDQGVLGQMLDFGDITVNGIVSSIGADRLNRIAAPNRLRSHVIAGEHALRPPPVAVGPVAPAAVALASLPVAAVPAPLDPDREAAALATTAPAAPPPSPEPTAAAPVR